MYSLSACHQISLPGNIFGVLILDMGEGVGENFVLKPKSDIHKHQNPI